MCREEGPSHRAPLKKLGEFPLPFLASLPDGDQAFGGPGAGGR